VELLEEWRIGGSTFAGIAFVNRCRAAAGQVARNENFPDPARLFVQPDHYVHRMLL